MCAICGVVYDGSSKCVFYYNTVLEGGSVNVDNYVFYIFNEIIDNDMF